MQITQAGVVWTDPPEGERDPGRPVDQAREFALEMLKEGPMETKTLYEIGAERGFAQTTLYRATKSLGLERPQWGWVALPEDTIGLDAKECEKVEK